MPVPFGSWPTLRRVLHVLGEHGVEINELGTISMPDTNVGHTYALEITHDGKVHYAILQVNSAQERATPSILSHLCRRLKLSKDIFDMDLPED